MKFYSEKTKQFYDTEEQCLAAEEAARKSEDERRITKAKLAKEVEEADNRLNASYTAMEEARKRVKELRTEFEKKASEILNPAKEEVTAASKARAEAIRKFNDNFGAYTTTYTGDRAMKEWLKLNRDLDVLWGSLFSL